MVHITITSLPEEFKPRRRRTRRLRVVDDKIVFRKLKDHTLEASREVIEFVKNNLDLINWIIYDSPVATSFRHPGSVRSLILLLYARAHGVSVLEVARKHDVAHEQLYRIERLLDRHGLKDKIYSVLKKVSQ